MAPTPDAPRDPDARAAAGAGFVRPLSRAQIAAGQAKLAERYGRPDAPPIRNAAFAAALDLPLEFTPGGVPYRVRPLSFPMGLRLYALARQFAETRRDAQLTAPAPVAPAVAEARLLYRVVALSTVAALKSLMRPHGLRARWRALRDGHAVDGMDAATLQLVLDQLLGLPDEIARRAPLIRAGEVLPPIDCLDDLGQFAEHLPAWVGADGYPLSWRHFRVGSVTLARGAIRNALLLYQAVGITHAEPRTQEQWIARLRLSAGMEN